MKNGSCSLLVSAVLLLPLPVCADEHPPGEQDYFAALPTLSAATRLSQQQRDLPAQVTLIDRAMIEASGAVNIVDLLRLVPGFQVYHVLANKFGVVSHGQGEVHPGRLEVMIDGRSVYTAIVSTVDWRALGITLDDIDHIEVVHGPNVATHGSNAFLGAINIVTRTPPEQAGSRLSLTAGSLETRELDFSTGGQLGDVAFRFSGSFLGNDGTGTGIDTDPISGDPFALKIEDGGEISQLGLRAYWTPTLYDSVDLGLGVGFGQFGIGDQNHPRKHADREVDNNYQNLTWTRTLDGGGRLRLQGYHHYLRYRQSAPKQMAEILSESLSSGFGAPVIWNPDDPIPSWAELAARTGAPEAALEAAIPNLDRIAGEPSDQYVETAGEDGGTHRYDLELEYSGAIGDEVRALAGIGWRLDRIQSVPQLNTTDYISEPFYRAFGNLEWRPGPDWTFNAGAMAEYNNLIGGRLSPRLGANWHLRPGHTLRAATGIAYRTPSLLDWYQNSIQILPSNGAVLSVEAVTFRPLAPERVKSFELGYLLRSPRADTTLDLRWFYEDLDQLISDYYTCLPEGMYEVGDVVENPASNCPDVSDPQGRVFENRNGSRWRNQGIDLQIRTRPVEGSLLVLGYGYLDTEGRFDRGPFKENATQPDKRSPRHTLSLLASQQLGRGFSLSAAYYYMSEASWFKGSDPLAAYDRLDLRLARSFALGRARGRAELIVQNLGDSYLEWENNNLFETRTFLRLGLEF